MHTQMPKNRTKFMLFLSVHSDSFMICTGRNGTDGMDGPEGPPGQMGELGEQVRPFLSPLTRH
jgi:hypothetical protein